MANRHPLVVEASGVSTILELPTGDNLDLTGSGLVTSSNSNIELDPNGSGAVVFKGNATKGAGQFKLNCENNSHGITIKGPAHSAAANYTLTLPTNDGNADQQLKTDGSGNLAWVDAAGGRWTQIATSTIGASEVFSVEFSGISGYREYELRYVGVLGSSSLELMDAVFDYGSGFVSSGYALKSHQTYGGTTTNSSSFFALVSDATRKSVNLTTNMPNTGTAYGYMFGNINWTSQGALGYWRNVSHGINGDDRQQMKKGVFTNNSNRSNTITGVRIFASGGGSEDDEPVTSTNDGLAAGTFTLYGLKIS